MGVIFMKILVVFYSRTDNTRKTAEEIASVLECDMEEIIDTKNRSGALGYIKSGKDASRRKLTVLKEIINDPSQYDLLIIGTPLWAWHVLS
jgi:menaquinone-dependent protoporphyrinogen IX oxidase